METVVNRAAKNAASTDNEYSGTIAINPAMIRVDTMYETECTAMDFDCVDLLGDPHRAQLCRSARADGGRHCDARDHRGDDADVEESRQEAGERLDTDVAQ